MGDAIAKKDGWTVNHQVSRSTIHFVRNRRSLCKRFWLWWDRDEFDELSGEGSDPYLEKLKCKFCLRLLEEEKNG